LRGDTPAFTSPYFLNWDFAEAPVWTLGDVVRLPVEAPVPSAPALAPPTTPANRLAAADSFAGRKPGDELGIAALDMFFAVWPQGETPASPIWPDTEEWEK
jgi:hypothetical protein